MNYLPAFFVNAILFSLYAIGAAQKIYKTLKAYLDVHF